jgi:hypothetical protein
MFGEDALPAGAAGRGPRQLDTTAAVATRGGAAGGLVAELRSRDEKPDTRASRGGRRAFPPPPRITPPCRPGGGAGSAARATGVTRAHRATLAWVAGPATPPVGRPSPSHRLAPLHARRSPRAAEKKLTCHLEVRASTAAATSAATRAKRSMLLCWAVRGARGEGRRNLWSPVGLPRQHEAATVQQSNGAHRPSLPLRFVCVRWGWGRAARHDSQETAAKGAGGRSCGCQQRPSLSHRGRRVCSHSASLQRQRGRRWTPPARSHTRGTWAARGQGTGGL